MSAVAPRFLVTSNTTNVPAATGIPPSTVVYLDGTGPFAVATALSNTSATKPIGIAQEGSYWPPTSNNLFPTYAATNGQPITVYGEGEECLVKVSSAGPVTAGQDLTVDATAANGTVKAITYTYAGAYSTTAGIWKIGKALESVSAGDLCRVLVQIQYLPEVSS